MHVMLRLPSAHISHIHKCAPTVTCTSPPPPSSAPRPAPNTPPMHAFVQAAAVLVICCRHPDMVEGPCHHQSAAAKALRQPRDQIGIRPGTDLPQGLQLLVPGMQAYRSSEAGHHPHMTGLLDMPLGVSCPLPCPGARPAMVLHQDRGLDASFLGPLTGQAPTGTGILPQ